MALVMGEQKRVRDLVPGDYVALGADAEDYAEVLRVKTLLPLGARVLLRVRQSSGLEARWERDGREVVQVAREVLD